MSEATLINGIGRYAAGPKIDLAVVNVQRGKHYRFWLISMSCDPDYVFSIDGHDLTVIEADGTATEPETVNSIHILAGERNQLNYRCIFVHMHYRSTLLLCFECQPDSG
jgi:iron transport multicopper oxidase